MDTSLPRLVANIHDLVPFFSLKYDEPNTWTFVKLKGRAVPYLLSYMFKVPIPKRGLNPYDGSSVYMFTPEDIAAMQSQVESMGDELRCLGQGRIELGTLLLLTNSPRFPYTMHVSKAARGSDFYTCYDFILKLDIVAPEPRKEI